MEKQNKMMDWVWLLNAAANSTHEAKELYLEFSRHKQEFLEVRQNLSPEQCDYFEQEMYRNMEIIEGFKRILQEVIQILGETEQVDNE